MADAASPRTPGPISTTSRRDLLSFAARTPVALAAAVAGVSVGAVGCAGARQAPAPAAPPVVLGVANSYGEVPPATATAVSAGFSRANPGFAVAFGEAGARAAWRLSAFTAGGERPHTDLAPALRAVNFNADLLLPGTVAPAFSAAGGKLTRLPFEIQPIGIAYRPDVLDAAGVPPPAPDWTYAEFLHGCATVAAAIRSGQVRHSGVGYVLPLMTDAARGAGGPQMADLSIWGSFLLGFGGALVEGGQAAVTTPESQQGIRALLDLVREYGNDAGAPPPGVFQFPMQCAFQFQYLRFTHPTARTGSAGPGNAAATGATTAGASAGPAYARFPALPVRAVQPADLGSLGLVPGPPPPGGAQGTPPPSILEAVGRFFVYFYSSKPQTLLGDVGHAPVSADLAVQKAFWSQYNMAVDPADIVFPDWDWSPYLRHNDIYANIEPVLSRGIADPQTLTASLASFATQLAV